MEIFIQLLLLAAGFILLIKGADWFVLGASKLADRFGIPQIVIGLTIVAMGTSAPEAAVSITAAVKGSAEITIGNIVGSNILNIWIILGLTSILVPLAVQKNTIRFELPFLLAVSAILGGMGLTDGIISLSDGVILWALFLVFLVYLFILSRRQQGEEPKEQETRLVGKRDGIGKLLAVLVAGMCLIIWGSDITVKSASEIARMFNWSERLIGLTIVALGTSLPELVTSVTAGRRGNADIAIGNIVGSNIFNILFVVGTTALITPVVYSAGFFVDTLVCAAAVLLLLVFVIKVRRLNRNCGIIMLVLYACYFVYLLR